MLLTEQEVGDLWRLPENYGKPLVFSRAIEAKVIEAITTQGVAAWASDNGNTVISSDDVNYTPNLVVSQFEILGGGSRFLYGPRFFGASIFTRPAISSSVQT